MGVYKGITGHIAFIYNYVLADKIYSTKYIMNT